MTVTTVADICPILGKTVRTNGWQGTLDAISLAEDREHIALRVGGVTVWVPLSQPAEVVL